MLSRAGNEGLGAPIHRRITFAPWKFQQCVNCHDLKVDDHLPPVVTQWASTEPGFLQKITITSTQLSSSAEEPEDGPQTGRTRTGSGLSLHSRARLPTLCGLKAVLSLCSLVVPYTYTEEQLASYQDHRRPRGHGAARRKGQYILPCQAIELLSGENGPGEWGPKQPLSVQVLY